MVLPALGIAAGAGRPPHLTAGRVLVTGGAGFIGSFVAERFARGGFEVFYPEPELCTDNGAMIAFAAAQRLAEGAPGGHRFGVKPRWDLTAAG